MTQPNRVAIALSGIASGATGGAALATVCVWIANWMAMNGVFVLGDPGNLVFGGTALGLGLAVFLGWRTSLGIEEAWRRGVIGVLAGFGAVLLGMGSVGINMLSLMLASGFFSGLLMPGYLVVLATVSFFAMRIARKNRPGASAPAA